MITGDGTHADDWRSRRAERAEALGDVLERRRAAESARARAMLREFVEEAAAAGPPPVPLRAHSAGGRRYRTPLQGWYLRGDESAAVTTDGEFYLLTVPGGVGALVRGVHLEPSDPPLVLGRGGRDGESIDLADALARLRAGGPGGA